MIIASNWFVSGLYLLVRMTIGHSFNNNLIMYDPSALNECQLNDWKHKTLVAWMGITLFMVAPLIINIVSYTLIIKKLSSERMKSINSVTILTRSILICALFTLSWMPSVIIGDILQMNDRFGWQIVGKWFFYLNCLTDPILYAFSSKPISACLQKLQVFKSTSSLSLSRGPEIVKTLRRLSNMNKVHPSQQSCRVRFSVNQSICEEDNVCSNVIRSSETSLPTVYSD